jgi:hypothetical protein
MSFKYGISNNVGLSPIDGRNPIGFPMPSAVNLVDGEGFEYEDGSGTQSGSHPAKTQSKTLRPLSSE